jgi:hypothetical protein
VTFLLFQVAQESGLRIDPAWVITSLLAVVSTLTGTIAFLYRGQIAALRERIAWLEVEGQRKDARADRLISMVGRTADGLDRTVSLAEKDRGSRR